MSILRNGSIMSKDVASRHNVVDSPPGMISPSTDSSSSGRRTVVARAPAAPSGPHVLADVALQGENADQGRSLEVGHGSPWGMAEHGFDGDPSVITPAEVLFLPLTGALGRCVPGPCAVYQPRLA